MRTRKAIRAGLATLLAAAALITVTTGPASAKLSNSFQGTCNSSGCILDEPAGNNPATHGTVTYDGTTLTITTTGGLQISEVHICTNATTAYVQSPLTCSGITPDRIVDDEGLSGTVYTKDVALLAYWTVHVVAGGRTLQVICNNTDCGGQLA